MNISLKNPIILALDVDDQKTAFDHLKKLGHLIGAVKLGPRLVYRYGSEFVNICAKICPVFVDNKYFDIPSTMVAAVQASFDSGATLVTVHALSGSEALKQLADLEKKLNQIRPFKILAVTILTSWDEKSFPPSFNTLPVQDHVVGLANLVVDSGLSGIVCSGHELNLLKDKNLYKVVPGIRFASGTDSNTGSNHDQKRVMSPKEALTSGAQALVIGRALLESKNPEKDIQDILN